MNIEEKDTDTEEIPEDTEIDTDDGADDELELDENGDIVIPDDGEEEEGEEPEEEEEDTEDGEDEGEGDDEEPEDGDEEEKPDTAAELEELKARLAKYEKHGRAALRKLGVKDEKADLIDALDTLAAESEGKTLDEYRKEQKDAEETEEAKALIKRTAFENLKKADLAALHAAYPETAEIDDVEKMENFKRFAELRDAGLSVKEAYAAANPDGIRKSASDAGKKSAFAGTKSHLKSNVPKGAKGEGVTMSPAEMNRWREMFPDKSKKEIMSLYKRANS